MRKSMLAAIRILLFRYLTNNNEVFEMIHTNVKSLRLDLLFKFILYQANPFSLFMCFLKSESDRENNNIISKYFKTKTLIDYGIYDYTEWYNIFLTIIYH